MTTLPGHEVALEVDGYLYSGWTSVDIDRSIAQMSGSFFLSLASKERTSADDWPILDGAACRVILNGVVIITGFIDAVSRYVSADDRGIDVRGRDLTADLVDCSAIHKTGSWKGRKLEAIAAEIVKPFGVPITLTSETGKAFKRFALQPGETVFSAIERMCRYRGLVPWSPGDGSLQIGSPDLGPVIGLLREGDNVLEASGSRDQSDRFSQYIVKGQSSGDDERNGATVAQVKGEAIDPGVARYRPLLLIGEEQSDQAALKKRAEWEAAVRSGRSQTARITVPGWLSRDGMPFMHGYRALCDVPSAGIVGELLIERLRFVRDAERGTFTVLDLVPPEAWTQLPEPEPKA